MKYYKEEENYNIARASAAVVMDNYGEKTRVKEIVDFCKQMKYKKIGLAFCVGLAKEANIFIQILKKTGFDVESIICKVGSVEREIIGIENCNVPMCNPIAQAQLLLEENKKLKEQTLCQETKDFLAALNLLYWEKNDTIKKSLLNLYKKMI